MNKEHVDFIHLSNVPDFDYLKVVEINITEITNQHRIPASELNNMIFGGKPKDILMNTSKGARNFGLLISSAELLELSMAPKEHSRAKVMTSLFNALQDADGITLVSRTSNSEVF